MFDNLSQRLSRVVKQLRGEARLTECHSELDDSDRPTAGALRPESEAALL